MTAEKCPTCRGNGAVRDCPDCLSGEVLYPPVGTGGKRATDAEILEDLRDQIANSGDC